MIEFANENTTSDIKNMWKICFGETDTWLSFYFSKRYKSTNTLIYIADNQIVASLQIYDYQLKFFDKIIPINYICGICTLPEYRKQGFSKALINEAHKIIQQKNVPISILIPADENLFPFYRNFGYEQFFWENKEEISLKKYIENSTSLEDAYKKFNKYQQNSHIVVLKTFDDFQIIYEENQLSKFETKTNCNGMIKIFNADLFDYQVDNLQKIFSNNNAILNFMLE